MENSSLARKVGLFGFVGLLLIGLLLVNFSRGAAFWKPRYEITVRAEGVGGLKPGAFIMMSGVPIGTVNHLILNDDGRKVLIECAIESQYKIHADARFEIEQSGFLGDQFVSVTPQANRAPELRDGGSVDAAKPFSMSEALRSAVSLMQRLEGAATKLDGAVGRMDKGIFSDAVIANLTNTIANARRVSERADSALRSVEQLIQSNTPLIEGSLSNVQAFSGRLNDFAGRMDALTVQMSGVISNADTVILSNKADLQIIVSTVKGATADLKGLSGDLQNGRGVAGALLKDPAMQDRFRDLMGNLTVLSSNLSANGIFWKPRTVRVLTNDLRHPSRGLLR